MTGWEQNENAGAFCNASLDEAGHKLAAILREEKADVLTTYDWHGGYGHPDHIMVHKVGHRAAELFPDVRVLEGTMNRDQLRRGLQAARDAGMLPPDREAFNPDGPMDDGNPMGSLESEINLKVDVVSYASKKRAAMKCHASQLSDSSFFLSMDDERFAHQFGFEWFIDPKDDSPMRDGWIFE
jgi:LmbE family N-acetylglucosaminyl deacetylase